MIREALAPASRCDRGRLRRGARRARPRGRGRSSRREVRRARTNDEPRPLLAIAARCRAQLAGARGDLDLAAAALDEALEFHDRATAPFDLARTLLSLGRLQRRRKQRKAARESFDRALEVFEQLGAPLWAEKAQAELERTHLREAPSELTPTEEQIARLAASGLKNREIAERMFVSPKTVEANLARVYRKLGSAPVPN